MIIAIWVQFVFSSSKYANKIRLKFYLIFFYFGKMSNKREFLEKSNFVPCQQYIWSKLTETNCTLINLYLNS